MSFENIIGGCVAVIVAGMPAIIALLKIRQLHLAVNGRMDKFIDATLQQTKDREAAVMKESESRLAELTFSRDLLIIQNKELISHLAKIVKRIDSLPCLDLNHPTAEQKAPCPVCISSARD